MRSTGVVLLVAAVVMVSGPVSGAVILIETDQPGVAEDGMCSLAEAVDNANLGSVHGDCPSGDAGIDVIELGAGELYESTRLTITDDLVINGSGASVTGENEDSLIDVIRSVVVVNDLAIVGNAVWDGWHCEGVGVTARSAWLMVRGCAIEENCTGIDTTDTTLVVQDTRIANQMIGISSHDGTVKIDNSVLERNRDFIGAGGIQVSGGTCSISRSIVRQSQVVLRNAGVSSIRDSFITDCDGSYGGAVSVFPGPWGELHVERSTISGNSVPGIYSDRGTRISVISSTISDNTGHISRDPANILVSPSLYEGRSILEVRRSTLLASISGYAKNILVEGWNSNEPRTLYAQVIMESSVLSKGSGRNCAQSLGKRGLPAPPNIEVDWVSLGSNLADDESCELDQASDMTLDTHLIPEFSPLEDWGGFAPTHMPLQGNPAIDMDDGPCPDVDQRGFVRPVDGDGDGELHCDCGAVEAGSKPPPEMQTRQGSPD